MAENERVRQVRERLRNEASSRGLINGRRNDDDNDSSGRTANRKPTNPDNSSGHGSGGTSTGFDSSSSTESNDGIPTEERRNVGDDGGTNFSFDDDTNESSGKSRSGPSRTRTRSNGGRKTRRTSTEENPNGSDGFPLGSLDEEPEPRKVKDRELESLSSIKPPKLKDALKTTFMTTCTAISSAPNPSLRVLRITEDEAEALGSAWASYIESFPSKKRRAAMEVISRIVPSVVAFGTTWFVFAPRVDLARKVANGSVILTPQGPRLKTTPTGVKPPFEKPPWPEQQKSQHRADDNLADDIMTDTDDSGLTPEERNSIINANFDGDIGA